MTVHDRTRLTGRLHSHSAVRNASQVPHLGPVPCEDKLFSVLAALRANRAGEKPSPPPALSAYCEVFDSVGGRPGEGSPTFSMVGTVEVFGWRRWTNGTSRQTKACTGPYASGAATGPDAPSKTSAHTIVSLWSACCSLRVSLRFQPFRGISAKRLISCHKRKPRRRRQTATPRCFVSACCDRKNSPRIP